MNIDTEKFLKRFALFLLFWGVIVLVGLLFPPGGGGGNGGGAGTGSAAEGSGTGQGEDTRRDGAGKGGGTLKEKQPQDNDADTSGAWGISENPDAAKDKPEKAEPPQSALMVHSKDNLKEDVATIHLPRQTATDSTTGGTSAGFFGIPVKGSDRIIFLLDTSGSMSSTTREGSGTRLDLLKREMQNGLTAGNKDAKKNNGRGVFRIVSFNSNYLPHPKQGRHSFSAAGDIASAKQFISQLRPDGGTNMLGAWKFIIPMIRREKITTVCFLTDGDSGDCTPDQLLDELKKSVPQLRIHTITMGQSSDLLKKIAKQHNGIYREVF